MHYVKEILENAGEMYVPKYDYENEITSYGAYDRFSIQLIDDTLWLVGHQRIDYSPDHEDKLEQIL